jgi:hypothetical protein
MLFSDSMTAFGLVIWHLYPDEYFSATNREFASAAG